MNKKRSIILITLLGSIIVICFGLLLVYTFGQYLMGLVIPVISNPQNNFLFSNLSKLSNFFVALFSLINLVIIIWFFMSDKKDRKNERISKSNLYWFRTIIFETNYEKIDLFFEKSEEILGRCNNYREILGREISVEVFDKEIKKEILKYNNERNEIISSLADKIRILDEDLGKEINLMLETFQDEFTVFIDKMVSDPDEYTMKDGNNILMEQKIKLLNKLYTYEKNIIDNQP